MDKKESKLFKQYIEKHLSSIMDTRMQVLESDSFDPKYIYMCDRIIWDPKKDDLRVNKAFFDTGSSVLGMKIILDYRIPMGQFFLTSHRLEVN